MVLRFSVFFSLMSVSSLSSCNLGLSDCGTQFPDTIPIFACIDACY
jgi:hypothetical protein